ncbi:hypothetical protein AO735_01710 [Pseudomonas sp. TTU2014-096BSC]|nr:hypothetical protein AO735_01710 [Pseudomonas sp. TTU2014-096BSC]
MTSLVVCVNGPVAGSIYAASGIASTGTASAVRVERVCHEGKTSLQAMLFTELVAFATAGLQRSF